MTAPARIKQADIERAAKAIRKSGFEAGEIVIDGTKMRIILGSAQAVKNLSEGPNPLDGIKL